MTISSQPDTADSERHAKCRLVLTLHSVDMLSPTSLPYCLAPTYYDLLRGGVILLRLLHATVPIHVLLLHL